jgi:hypothetical protein
MADPTILMDGFSDWQLKPEGLCRDDTCVPVRDHADLAGSLRRPVLADESSDTIVIGEPASARHQALSDHKLPDFELPDLDGVDRQISEWRGRKKLLVAFASW